jgi:DNA-binding transcriptional ArsR family regulator
VDKVAAAIADPVRREILEMLRGDRFTAGAIAARFAISRPAVSRHLRVLRDSGLVSGETRGRERYYALNTAPLHDLGSWIAALERPAGWEHRLDSLATEVHRTRRERRAAPGTPEDRSESPTSKETSA